MTKSEFYSRYKDSGCNMDDLMTLINDEELWDDLYIRDRQSFEEYMYEEIRDYVSYSDSWTDVRDWLCGIDEGQYYLFEDQCLSCAVWDADVDWVLDKIEDILSDIYSAEWESEEEDLEFNIPESELLMLYEPSMAEDHASAS